MRSRMAGLMRIGLAVALLATAGATRPPTPKTSAPTVQPRAIESSMIPEVRLRKLHLVRPDLIPYPIAYEVIC